MAQVNMEDLKPNSSKYKEGIEPREHAKKESIKPLVSRNNVVQVKKSPAKQFLERLLKEDLNDFKDHMIKDVILPGIGYLVLDSVSMAFFGRTVKRNSSDREPRSRYNYNARYRGDDDYERRSMRRREDEYYSGKQDYRSVVLTYREDAEKIVRELRDRIHDNREVTIAELFGLVDAPSDFVDWDWGWIDEQDIGLRRTEEGWLIDVSKARYLKGR